MVKKLCLTVLALLLLGGCAEPRIDTTTKQTAERSIQQVREALPPDQREEFQQVLAEAAFAGVMQSAFTGVAPSPESLFSPFHGMTGPEALAHAKKMKADEESRQRAAEERLEAARREREAEERRQDEKELAELQAIVDAKEQKTQLLSRIQITDHRVLEKRHRFGRDYAMSGQVFNGLDVPLSVVFVKADVRLPGRAVPLTSADIAISVPGGVEPGESVRFDDGGTSMDLVLIHKALSENPAAQLHVEVTGAWDANEESISNAPGLSEYGQRRFEELKKRLAQ